MRSLALISCVIAGPLPLLRLLSLLGQTKTGGLLTLAQHW